MASPKIITHGCSIDVGRSNKVRLNHLFLVDALLIVDGEVPEDAIVRPVDHLFQEISGHRGRQDPKLPLAALFERRGVHVDLRRRRRQRLLETWFGEDGKESLSVKRL